MRKQLRVPLTRSVLLRLRSRREALLGAAELLERKRRILGQKMVEMLPRWESRRREAYARMSAAYRSFVLTRMRSTSGELRQIVAGSAPMISVEVHRQTLAGVPTFEVSSRTVPLGPLFGLLGSTAEMDRTITSVRDAADTLAQLAGEEATLRSLAGTLHKTSRQVRMLRDRLIPLYEATIHEIENVLDEEERAYLFQLKRLR